MNVQPPLNVNKKEGQVHLRVNDKTGCNMPITNIWKETNKPVSCQKCLGVKKGWNRLKRR